MNLVDAIKEQDVFETVKLEDSTNPQVVDLVDAIHRAVKISHPTAISIEPYLETYTTIEVDQIGTLELTNMDPVKGSPTSLNSIATSNGSSVEQSVEFKNSTETTNSISSSLTLGFTYKQTINAKVSIPEIMEVGSSMEFGFSLSSTQTKTEEIKQTFEWDWPIKAVPHKTTKATALLSNFKRSPNYSQKLQIKATGGTYDAEKEGYRVYAFVKETIFDTGTWWYTTLGGWLGRLDEFEYISPNEVHFTAKGQLTAVYGKDLQCMITETDFPPSASNLQTKVTHLSYEGNVVSEEHLSAEATGNPDN